VKTEHLVQALVADQARGDRSLGRLLAVALLAGGVISLVLFLATLGPRPDLVPALSTWRFDLKVALVAAALGVAFVLCRALGRPVPAARPGRYLLALAAIAVLAVAIELAVAPMDTWGRRLVGSNSLICLTAVPAFSLAPLVAVLAMLRSAAPSSPALAGAAAGLVAATAGALLYAFHCFDDSPLFVVTWYGLAMAVVTTIGWLAGRKLLRW
jgi:hypothetical protein